MSLIQRFWIPRSFFRPSRRARLLARWAGGKGKEQNGSRVRTSPRIRELARLAAAPERYADALLAWFLFPKVLKTGSAGLLSAHVPETANPSRHDCRSEVD